MIGNDRQAVFPHQSPQPGHFGRLAAQVDLPVLDASAIEVLAQRFAVWASIGGKYEDGVECHHAKPRNISALDVWEIAQGFGEISGAGFHVAENARVVAPAGMDLDPQA